MLAAVYIALCDHVNQTQLMSLRASGGMVITLAIVEKANL